MGNDESRSLFLFGFFEVHMHRTKPRPRPQVMWEGGESVQGVGVKRGHGVPNEAQVASNILLGPASMLG